MTLPATLRRMVAVVARARCGPVSVVEAEDTEK